MTGDGAAGPDDETVADDLRGWAAAADDATDALGAVVAALPGAWADAVGREWAERLRLVGVVLARAADEARGLARHVERAPATDVLIGVRLGDQSGTRVTDRRGVVIPVLPPP